MLWLNEVTVFSAFNLAGNVDQNFGLSCRKEREAVLVRLDVICG